MTGERAPGAPGPGLASGGSGHESPSLYRMTPFEVAWGWVPGTTDAPRPSPGSEADPVRALEDVIRPALCRPPCVVQFSGGRDSSLVLAVALRLARREGLPEPVAYTKRFAGLEEAGEEQWQEQVIAHLGAGHWERVEVADELDLVGPTCGPSLERLGLLWPPMVHARHFEFARARGGSMLDGEGGDEVFGAGRLAVVSAVLTGQLRPGLVMVKHAAVALSPRPVRRSLARRLYAGHLRSPWLRPDAWRPLEAALAEDFAGEPLDRRRSLLRHVGLRLVSLFLRNAGALAAEHDVLDVKPLLDTRFVTALGAAGGRLGYAGRTSAMTSLFSDLLPPEVLRRSSKARFNRAAFNVHSRAFAASWDGGGVDETLVDPDELRRAWGQETPSSLSFALLQAAFVASRRPTREH